MLHPASNVYMHFWIFPCLLPPKKLSFISSLIFFFQSHSTLHNSREMKVKTSKLIKCMEAFVQPLAGLAKAFAPLVLRHHFSAILLFRIRYLFINRQNCFYLNLLYEPAKSSQDFSFNPILAFHSNHNSHLQCKLCFHL